MQRHWFTGCLVLADAITVVLAAFFSLYLRFDGQDLQQAIAYRQYEHVLWQAMPVLLICYLGMLVAMHVYRYVWRYAERKEIFHVELAGLLATVLFLVYTTVWQMNLPRSFYFIDFIFTTVAISMGRRLLQHVQIHASRQFADKPRPVLIVGAGNAGVVLGREIMQLHTRDRVVVGFMDDDEYKQGKLINGIKVLGGRWDISSMVHRYKVEEIIIAMPSVEPKQISEIVTLCKDLSCRINVLPGLYQLMDGKASMQQLRPLQIEDLLPRDPVKLDLQEIAGYLTDKVVLITGAGGSIGSELCRQVMKMKPKQLVLLGRGENSIYLIHQELIGIYGRDNIVPVIASVCDKERLEDVFDEYQPQVVFHAAAHKHVPLMEIQPKEAVHNNIYGGFNVGETAGKHGVETFITVSTDKAVNPTSIMGASKRVVEMIMQVMNHRYATKYVTVRFGNVLGSRGSVVPLFKKQIAAGGPVTVTDPEMKRYFMTIPEASQLVLQAGAMGKGGEVFVLDMGKPVKIVDLAKNMIRLCGNGNPEIKIEFTGLRPGEKLFEELLTAEEGTDATKNKKIFSARLKGFDEDEFQRNIDRFAMCSSDEDFLQVLQAIIPTYTPNHKDGRINYRPAAVEEVKALPAVKPEAAVIARRDGKEELALEC